VLLGVYARRGGSCGLILSGTEECGKLSVRTVVFSERAECWDPSTDERVVLNREGGIGERGGSVSIRATGRLFSCSAIGTS
jgi:hypothetical protein